jgi:hypothetical protein
MANRVLLGDDSIPGSAITVYVTVVSVGGANKFAIDGIVGANIELQNGTTYTFDQSDSSNSGHPFRFSNNIDGTHASGGNTYGYNVSYVGTAGNAGAYTRHTAAGTGTPHPLYYFCSSHSGMGDAGQLIIRTGGGKVGLRISKPGQNALTATGKDLLINTNEGRTGQIFAGGTDLSASGTELNPGYNFRTGTGVTKPALGYIPLVITREDNNGDTDVSSSSNDETYMESTSFFKTTNTYLKPTAMNINISNISSSNLSNGNWNALDGATRAQTEACTNLKYYVLRIPLGYGYMTSTYYG